MNIENIDLKEALSYAESGWREAILYAREQKEKCGEKDIQIKILTNEVELLQRQLLLRIHCEKEIQETISNSVELLSISSNNLILATQGEEIKEIQSPTKIVKIKGSNQFIVGHNDRIEKISLSNHKDSLNNINKKIKRAIEWIILQNELQKDRDKIINSPINSPTTRTIDNNEIQTTIIKSDTSIASPITLLKNEFNTLSDSNHDEFNNNDIDNNVLNSLKINNVQINSPIQSITTSNSNLINNNVITPVVKKAIEKKLLSSSENNIVKKINDQNESQIVLKSAKKSSILKSKASLPTQNQKSNTKPGLPSNKPGLPSNKPGLPSNKPGLPCNKPGLPSNKPGLPSNKPGLPSNKKIKK